jgi:hypothetical protein
MRVTRTTKTLSRTTGWEDATFGPTLTLQEGFRIKSGPRNAKCYTPSPFFVNEVICQILVSE